ncbi:putative transcription factor Nin-like family [Helianthus annuus]|uniref:Putative RWP-RK domain-containing protein n=1 Tax=Helianthus annuus TaxID=4232 RepID=A0A251TWT3_HELAN|nr:protein RKD5 [Helianthus annuus]KAF5798512.1 putative transcription factor Nin-like family [Helianthus annuus]KAJ0550096.1 putative transcription factor Nin-like family [Helianthus annuus]KAJ0556705.1 putative transcription factor Nin-like family [Helianthus annuus]KAJ0563050.1 putative transcription factor Nin-like family [Helianthus annuus]KAJ0728420.1 putative transcription factor Nin-like family [Helianthus annuus]
MASLSQHSPSLKALVAFRNLIRPELIRTVHLYRSDSKEGGGEVEVEREFVFHKERDYEEISFCKVFTLHKFEVSSYFEGLVNGVWLCIFVFDKDCWYSGDIDRLPTVLTVSRNRKLETIPSLSNDIQTITQLTRDIKKIEECNSESEEASKRKEDKNNRYKSHHMCDVDLNSLPYGSSENEESDQSATDVSWKKKKRAATKDIASLGLEDLAKYFDVPIIEASKNLKVGLTVLKKKCREFGIPRWPHRKIKSLDGLISDLQEEVKRQQEEDEEAALAVAQRQKMIESEKERIEKKPFMDIQRETKKFRQDIFKKRHRARVLENQGRTLPLF